MFGYEIRTAFMVLFLAQNIFGNSASMQQNHTHVTEQPNGSNIPAKSATEANSHGSKVLKSVQISENFTNIVRLENVLVIFDLNELATNWPRIRHKLKSNCQHDMSEYFRGLQQHRIWAIKMDDASGRYTPGLFYGNNYWLGSLSLCESIYKASNSMKPTIAPVQTKEIKDAITYNDFTRVETVQHENPPFLPGFFVLKARINETEIVQYPRTFRTGICLPSTCTLDDVEHMAILSQRPIPTRHIEIISIQSPTQDSYDFWNDRTFIVLSTVTIIVFILMFIATVYELYLESRIKALKRKNCTKEDATDSSSGIGCTTYDLTRAVPNKNELGIGIVGIPCGMNNDNSDANLAEVSTNVEEIKLGVCSELLLSFSVITNFKTIWDQNVGQDSIPAIHGLRAVSMVWVILGHTMIIVFKYADNMELRREVENGFWFQAILNGSYSVDTFFFISGFLVSYLYFRNNASGKLEKLSKGVSEMTAGTFHFFGLIFYRFVRLTVPYMYVLFVVEIIMKHYHHHSVFETSRPDHENCPNYWWRNLLYINTLFPVEQMCMLWSWYLADDTQFFIVGAIILIISVRHFKVAASMLIVLMVSSWTTTSLIAYQNDHVPSATDPLALFDKIYNKPWTRLGPYMVGMCVGWFLFKTNCKIHMSRTTLVIGYSATTICCLWLVFGTYFVKLGPAIGAVYTSLSHTAWAMSIAWIVIICSSGYGGYINQLLSAPIIYPWSRVTYCTYLIHPILIRYASLTSDGTLHLGGHSLLVMFYGHMVLSFLLAMTLSLSFEAPVVAMLKILSPNRKKVFTGK